MALWTVTRITSYPSNAFPVGSTGYTIAVADTESTAVGVISLITAPGDDLVEADVKAEMVANGYTPTDIP